MGKNEEFVRWDYLFELFERRRKRYSSNEYY